MSATFILFMQLALGASLLSSFYMGVRRFRDGSGEDHRARQAATGAALGFAGPLAIAVLGYGMGATLTWAVNVLTG